MTEPIEDAYWWLEAHRGKHVAVIETRIIAALLHHIEKSRQDELSRNSGQLPKEATDDIS